MINAISLEQGNEDLLCTKTLILLYLVFKNSTPTKKVNERIENEKKFVELNFDYFFFSHF